MGQEGSWKRIETRPRTEAKIEVEWHKWFTRAQDSLDSESMSGCQKGGRNVFALGRRALQRCGM